MPPLQRRRSMGDRSRRTADGGGRLHSAAAGIVGLAPPAVDPPCVAPTPSDPPPLNGGEFLLQLLRRPPQSSAAAPSPAPSASPLPIDGQRGRQHLPHGQYEDPAVAAVGPSHPFSPPNFSNFGSPQQQFPPWLFPQVQSQPPRPSPPLGFSPPAGFSVSPPAGFSVSPPVGYSTSPPVGYSASPPGINYHEPRSLSGGNRPSFFQREAGQPPVFAPRNLDNGDHRGNLRDTFSQQQQQQRRQQPNSNYKQNHQRDVFSAGGTASGNVMFGSQMSNLQPNGGRGLITGNPSAFAGRSQLGAESRNSKAGPASGHDRWLGNGGSEENKPLPSSRRAPHPEGWSGQPGNQHPVRETRPHAPMTGQAPPGFHDPPVQRHSRMDSRREASNSQQKPNGSGHRTLMDNGSDRDFGLKRHEYPQRKQNHQSFAQRMGTQANERQVQLDADQYLSHPVAELDVKELIEDTLSEDEDEDAFLEENDNEIEHNSEPKAISSSTLYEVKSLSVQLEDSLVLKEEVVECEVKKSRKKDFRTDFSRGYNVSTQRYRIRRGAMQCRRDIRKLSPHFFSIYELLVPTEEEKSKQKQLLLLLQKIVTKEWPRAQLHLYGSCANSFGVLKSDIDVCLEIDDIETNKSDLLLNLAEMLQSDNLQNVQALTRARVPIVKLMDPVTGLSCDICINNLLAVVNTKLLRDYGKIDERLRQLAFIVKHWAKSRGVNETYQGTLSSYAYVIMCIHFLQMRRPPILPCLQMLEPTYITTVDGVECSFFDQVEKLQNFGSANKESVAELLWAFFNYWAYRHDYANDVISVRTGSILSKREKDWTRRIGNDRHLICIEDPFEVSHDLGRVVDKHTIKILREEFERAADILQFDANPCAVLFEPYVREPPPPSPPAAENQAELGVV